LAEFRELDSYLTDSEDGYGSEYDRKPSLAQTEFDNDILRMGRSLMDAAREQSISGTNPPQVTMRLTRLDPTLNDAHGNTCDPRISKTIQALSEMGIDVQLGERESTMTAGGKADSHSHPQVSREEPYLLKPTMRINLDLSVLLGLVSDLTHATLPASVEEAKTWFIPPQNYLNRNKNAGGMQAKRSNSSEAHNATGPVDGDPIPTSNDDWCRDYSSQQPHQLTKQILQEMDRGLLDTIKGRLVFDEPPALLEFWTTSEARDRCLQIVSTSGGPSEKRRTLALFPRGRPRSTGELTKAFWEGSRYPREFIRLVPLKIFSGSDPSHLNGPELEKLRNPNDIPQFFHMLAQTCKAILSHETIPHPRSLPLGDVDRNPQIQRADVTKANPRLTAHTVKSVLWGACLGWTTMTANKSSVKVLLRETGAARQQGDIVPDHAIIADGDGLLVGAKPAAIWVVDPRSLSEEMRALKS
jgi:hypothetical protein